MGDYLLGIPINFATEETTNALQDYFTGSKTFISNGWGEAQTGALGMSVLFGTGGAVLTSARYGINSNEFSKDTGEAILKFVGSNKYKLSKKTDEFVNNAILPKGIKDSFSKANEKAKTFYTEMILGDTERTITTKKNGKPIEWGFKTLPKSLQDAIIEKVNSTLPADATELERRVLIGREVANISLFNDDYNKQVYDQEVDLAKIKELSEKIYKGQENQIADLADFVRKEALNDKIDLTTKDIMDITSDISLNPTKTFLEEGSINDLKRKASDYYKGIKTSKAEMETLLDKKDLSQEEYSKVLDYYENHKSLEDTMNVLVGSFLEDTEHTSKKKLSKTDLNFAIELVNELEGQSKIINMKNRVALVEYIADTYDITQSEESSKNQLAIKAIRALNKYYSTTDKSYEIIKKKENESKDYYRSQLKNRYANQYGDAIYLQDTVQITDELAQDVNETDLNKIFTIADKYAKTDGKNEMPFIEELVGKDVDPGIQDAVSKYLNTYKELYDAKNSKTIIGSTSTLSISSPKVDNPNIMDIILTMSSKEESTLSASSPPGSSGAFEMSRIQAGIIKKYSVKIIDYLKIELTDKTLDEKIPFLKNYFLGDTNNIPFIFIRNYALAGYMVSDDNFLTKEEEAKYSKELLSPLLNKKFDSNLADKLKANDYKGYVNTLFTYLDSLPVFFSDMFRSNLTLASEILKNKTVVTPINTLLSLEGLITKDDTPSVEASKFKDIISLINYMVGNYNGEDVTPIYGILRARLSQLEGDNLKATIGQLYHLVHTTKNSIVKLDGIDRDVYNFKSAILTTLDTFLMEESNKLPNNIVMAYGKPLYNAYQSYKEIEKLFTDEENFELLVEYSKIYESGTDIGRFIESDKFKDAIGDVPVDKGLNILKELGYKFFTLNGFQVYPYDEYKKLNKTVSKFISNYFQYLYTNNPLYLKTLRMIQEANPDLQIKRSSRGSEVFWIKDFADHIVPIEEVLSTESNKIKIRVEVKKAIEDLAEKSPDSVISGLLKEKANLLTLDLGQTEKSANSIELETFALSKGFKISRNKTGKAGAYSSGKISVREGLNDTEYQVVLGHEIAHGLFDIALETEENKAIKEDLDKVGKFVYDLLDKPFAKEQFKDGVDFNKYETARKTLKEKLESKSGYSLKEFVAISVSPTDKLFNELLNDLNPIADITEVEKKNNLFEQLLGLMRKILDYILLTDQSAGSQVKNLLDGLELANEFNQKAKKEVKKPLIETKSGQQILDEFDDVGEASFFPQLRELLEDDAELTQASIDYVNNPTKENLDKLNSLTDIISEELEDEDTLYFPSSAITPLMKERTDSDGESFYSYEHWDSMVRDVCDVLGVSVEGKTIHDFFKTFTFEQFESIFNNKEGDTDFQKTVKQQLRDNLKEKADFKHAYKISDRDIVKAKIKELYNRLTSLSRIQMLRVDFDGSSYNISKLPDEYKNDAGAYISNIKNLAVINEFVPTLSNLLGLDLELQQIDSFNSGENSGYRESGMKARDLAYAFNKEGMIYLNQFADRKTYPILTLKDNLSSKEVMEKIWTSIKPFYDSYIQTLGEEAYEYYDSSNITPREKAIIITQTVRTVLEDLKLGTTKEQILSGQTRLAGRDFVQLMKRWVLASITSKMSYNMQDIAEFEKEVFNSKPLISSDPTNSIYYKMENGKPRIYVRSIVLQTKGVENPLLKNADGTPRYDGGSICLLGQLDKVLRHTIGSVNKGVMKNFFYYDGIYLKHAVHQMSAKDNWGHLFAKNNIAFITNDECEKNQLGGDKYETTTWEELNEGNAKVIDLPLDGFNRVKESASFKEEVLGFAQVCNACGIIEENPWIDSRIPAIIREYTKDQASKLNRQSETELMVAVHEKVFATLKEPHTYMDNIFKASFAKKLLPLEKSIDPSYTYRMMELYKAYTPVKETLKHIMNKPIRDAVKLSGEGTKVTLTMDAGNLSGTRIKAIRSALKEKFGEEDVDEKLKDYVDENGFLKEDYGIIDSLTAERMGIKAFDKVIIYITPTDSAMGVKAIEVIGIVSNDDMPLSAMVVNSEYIQGVGKDYDIDEFTLLTQGNFSPKSWEIFTEGLKAINQTYKKESKKIIEDELKREANPFKSSDQLAFMQNFLGINQAVRPRTAKYHILEKDGIDVGDMFYKNIGEVVRLRELHQLLSQLDFKTEFEFKGKKYEVNINNNNWGKIHYMLLVATNDMVDYPKNNNKDYYNSDTRNMFAKILHPELKYSSPSDLALLEGKDLSFAKDMNAFIEQLFGSFLGVQSPITKMFSIPRFKNNSFGKSEYDKAKSISALKKIKSLNNSLKKAELFGKIDSSNPLKKFFENIKYDKENIYKNPIAILIDNINIKKLNDSINRFYYHKDRKAERLFNINIEFEMQKMMIEPLFGIKLSYIPQMLESAKRLETNFIPLLEANDLDKEDKTNSGIFLHKKYYNTMKRVVANLNGKKRPLLGSDILLETNREFFGAEGQTKGRDDLGIMWIPEYKFYNPKLITFREDIHYFFKTGGQGNTELTGFGKTSNYPKIIGMLALKALDRVNPINKITNRSDAMTANDTLTLSDLTLKRNNKVVQIIYNKTGESTVNTKIKVGSLYEKALLNLNQKDASAINKFLNLQEKNISTNTRIALAEEYAMKFVRENNLTQKEVNMVLFTHLGIPTFGDWGKHTSYQTSTSNANLFMIASRISPDFMSAYKNYFLKTSSIWNDTRAFAEKNVDMLKSLNQNAEEGSDMFDEETSYFPGDPEDFSDMEGIVFESPKADTKDLIDMFLASNIHELSEYNKINMANLRDMAFKDKVKAKKILSKLYNEVTVGQLLSMGRVTSDEIKNLDKEKFSLLVATHLNGTTYKKNTDMINNLNDAHKIINVGLSLNKIIDSSDKKEWTTLDKIVYSDLQLNIDVFARIAPKNYLSSDSLPPSLNLNFIYSPNKKMDESDYYLEITDMFDRLQAGYKNVDMSGVKALSLVDIIAGRQQLIENNLVYIQNIFSTHIKNNINSYLKISDSLDERLRKEKLLFNELHRINSLKDFEVVKNSREMMVKDDSDPKKKIRAGYNRYAEVIYPDDKEKQDILVVALQMKEMLSYHMPRFIGGLLRYMSLAESRTVDAGEKERIHKIVLKYSRIYNYMINGFSTSADVTAKKAPVNPFIPKSYSKEAWVLGYIQMRKAKAIKNNPGKTEDEIVMLLEEEANKKFSERDYFNPLFLNPKYYEIENESERFDVTMTGFLQDLLRHSKEDLTLINWYTYRNEAIRTNMPHFVTDKMAQWFKNLSTSNQILNDLKDKTQLKQGDYIFFRKVEEKEQEQAGLTYFIKFNASYGGQIEKINGNVVTIKVGEKSTPFNLSEIFTVDVYGNRIDSKVEVLPFLEKSVSETEIEKVDGKIAKALEGTMSTWILLTRGYLNALPSKVRNKIGGKFSGIEENILLFPRLFMQNAPEKVQTKLANILQHEHQSVLDTSSAYYKALAEVSNFGSKTILDMFSGGGLTELSDKALPIPEQNLLSKIKFFRELVEDAKVYDSFVEARKKIYSEMARLSKGDQRYKELQTKLNLLTYEQQLNEQQLQDRLSLIKEDQDTKDLYPLYKRMVESNNLGFKYSISSDMATKLYKQHMKETFVDKRMEFVNKDEGILRTVTFQIAFVEEYERSHNLDKSLIYAQNAVKRQHAFYNMMSRVFAHGKSKGRVLNALRHYTFNKMQVLKTLVKDTKEVKDIYGWKVLGKSVFSKDIRLNGDEVEIFGRKGEVVQYSPANRLANMITFNIFLYNLGSIVPGVQFVGNPVIMAVLGLTDVMMRSFDPDDEDMPSKVDVFYALAQALQLRGGVGKNFLYSSLIHYWMYEEGDPVRDIAMTYAPGSLRQVIKTYNLTAYLNEAESQADYLKVANSTSGLLSGFRYMDFNYDMPRRGISDQLYAIGIPFSNTLERLSSSPIKRAIERNIEDRTDINDYLDSLEDRLSKFKKGKRDKFNILNPFGKLGDYK
jgi:hypothetical protein